MEFICGIQTYTNNSTTESENVTSHKTRFYQCTLRIFCGCVEMISDKFLYRDKVLHIGYSQKNFKAK